MCIVSAKLLNRSMHFPRERDSTNQLIGSVEDVLSVVCALVRGDITWEDASARLMAYDGVQAIA